MSSGGYHFDTHQRVRDAKLERITRIFNYDEEVDRNEMAAEIGNMPSPRTSTWRNYIMHRLKMAHYGIQTYTQRSVARLRLDKHIRWHRGIDKIAGKLVNKRPALIHMGAQGAVAPSSPISIKKFMRCPGTRKLLDAFRRRGNCIVRMVDEYMTSQHCAKCFRQFPRWTRPKRYKLCNNCNPNPAVGLPELIITNVSKRLLQLRRAIERNWREMADAGNAVAALLTQRKVGRLVSKNQRFLKTWQPVMLAEAEENGVAWHKTVWHRDICAAKLMLYKGNY